MENVELIKQLRALGIKTVQADYDGGGDSGEVNGTYAKDKAGADVALPKDLSDAIDEAACAYLETSGIDWYNNDGGYGEWHLDVETGKQKLEHNQRITDTEYEEHEGDFLDEDKAKALGLLGDAEADAEEMLVCTCPTLKDGHHPGCPYLAKTKAKPKKKGK